LEEYLELDRSGRGTALNEDERKAVFEVYQQYQKELGPGCGDYDDLVLMALDLAEQGELPADYRAVVVDEIQDLTAAVMQLIRKIIPEGENDIFLVGDGLQRIYPGSYVLSRLGIDIVGRGALLRYNYRNTQEILQAAYTMMENQTYDDLDEEEASVMEPELSIRYGDKPIIHREADFDAEVEWVVSKILELKESRGYHDRDFAVLYRWRKSYIGRLKRKLEESGLKYVRISNEAGSYFGPGVKLTTFHSSKGLEFKVVFVVGATDSLFVPKDDATLSGPELEEYLARERSLLYVAMTRARDLLYITYSRGSKSRFLEDVPDDYLQKE
jgi:superfamily I DNA/RNA helicase